MKLALNGATTMSADLEADLHAAQTAGFDFVEIWAAKLYKFLQTRTVDQLKRLFAAANVRPLSINSIEHVTFRDADAYASIKHECQTLSEIASKLECPYIVVVPGRLPQHGASPAEIVDESVRVLRELAAIADAHGVALGFEFLGQQDCSVQTLAQAAEIVKRVDRRNVGLVIDSFHFYAGRSSIEALKTVSPDQIFVFHINDAEDLPREQLQDCHRLLPGRGILPLREMLKAFREIGYDKVASVEIFRPEYWELDPVALAVEARRSTEAVINTVS